MSAVKIANCPKAMVFHEHENSAIIPVITEEGVSVDTFIVGKYDLSISEPNSMSLIPL